MNNKIRLLSHRSTTAERMMLTKGRFVAGDEDLGRELEALIDRALYAAPHRPSVAADVRAMREKLEATAKGRDVKHGFGGLVDVEFIAEGLRLLHGHRLPAHRATSTLSTPAAPRAAGLIPTRDYEALLTAYQFLRSVESRMRIVYDMSLTRIPDDPDERSALARRLGYVDSPGESAGAALLVEYEHHARRTRAIFDSLFPPAS